MTPSTIANSSYAVSRSTPWLAITSGILGICSFVSLVAYITTPALQMQESGTVVPTGKLLLTIQFLASAAQVLMMIPVAIWIYRMGRQRSPGVGRESMILGIVALGGVGLLRLVPMVDTAVSDILFMLPMGLVGVWLVAVNWENVVALPSWMRMLGGIAGIGMVGVGLNFLFNGGMAVFSKGPMAYGNDVNFHIGLGLFGFPGFTLFAIWSVLLGLRFLRRSIG
ncbi:hypothetical protein HDF16_001939 [Granulicella aggregans]|uniref:DUF4386 domain-containing protein n=1 Tax=Granulicella aggregans TaxID=474949 RepID=A0A7W7ZCY1_9BACT|nr:hypothetical protein [Granulicella aggregans]MBB5057254.1 hypothetical protein [Granulicella aggregans]